MNNSKKRKLGRTASHRRSMMKNLAMSLILNGRIITTVTKAKELRPFIEKLITKAIHHNLTSDKLKALHLLRNIEKSIPHKNPQKILIGVWGAHFIERPGGYTRIIRMNRRLGDASEMATIMMVLDENLLIKYGQDIKDFDTSVKFLKQSLMLNKPQSLDLLKKWKYNGSPQFQIGKESRSEKEISFEIRIVAENLDHNYWPVFSNEYAKYPFTVIIDSRDTQIRRDLAFDEQRITNIPLFKDENRMRFLYSYDKKSPNQSIEISVKRKGRSRRANIKNTELRISLSGPLGPIVSRKFLIAQIQKQSQ